jgi:hypothetical protein
MKNLTIAFLAAASLFTVSACKKKNGAAEAIEKMGQLKDQMCKCTDKACADKVQADFDAYGKTMEKQEKPDQATVDKAMAIMGEYQKCAEKAMGAGAADGSADGSAAPAAGSADGSAAPAAGSADGSAAAADGSAAPAAAAGDIPQECKDYQAAIEALSKCDKMPAEARDAAKKAFDAMSATWASATPEAKAAAATGCKSAADSVKQSTAALCP